MSADAGCFVGSQTGGATGNATINCLGGIFVVQEWGFSYRHPGTVFSKMRRLIWGLSVEDGLRAYARMLNTLDIDAFAPLIADDFHYASQKVLDEMTSKEEFLEYATTKGRSGNG
jgi:hypothetical protein